MTRKSAEVLGITPPSHFPQCSPGHPHTQFCETDKLCIPYPNPDIHKLLEVCVSVIICSTREICTPIGKKLVIEAKKQIKIKFSTDDSCRSVYSAQFEIPFCTSIVLGDIKHEVIQVSTAIEDITIKRLDNRHLMVTSIIFLCPIFKKQHECSTYNCECHDSCKSQNNNSAGYANPEKDYNNFQANLKNYRSLSEWPADDETEVIRVDGRYYYGK
ncbi:SPOCS domain-containing protein [Sporomusa termitida]|uniref:SipL SPOCS domain-containing protein n=1 Tax=Sporomusa termitida TaxID=2377 RepID=A0A517DZM2_9FIRM|nr:SPOCS domain-containing protein [Sporomusa termitida]QDR82810.1 hypothetical protein SPTER_42410 [Sporomusa termitida]